MKNIIIIFILALLVIGLVIGFRIYKQNKNLESIDKAKVTDSEITEEYPLQTGDMVTITKTSSGLSEEGNIKIDTDNTYLKFTGFGPGKNHTGSFDSVKAEISFNDGLVSSGTLLIETSSINTGINGLDSHLKTEDFFEVEKYPQIKFNLVNVVMNNEDQSAIANGYISIKGTTKKISVPLVMLENGFAVDFLLDMELFGISYIGVNKEVQLEAQVILN
jgi:polyisoprenoid-binding protein YceI